MIVADYKKIIIGVFLIFFSFFVLFFAIYLSDLKSKSEGKNAAALSGEQTQAKQSQSIEPKIEKKLLHPLEGSLWFDKKKSKIVITLGSVNNLDKGQLLDVYDNNNNNIAEIIVDIVFDNISYVSITSQSEFNLDKSYYKVVTK